MDTSKNTRSIELLLILLTFLISNLTVIVRPLWKLPLVLWLQTILMVILAAILIGITIQKGDWKIFIDSLQKKWFFFPFLLFSFFSIFWSIQLITSFLRWIILLALLFIGGYIGFYYSQKATITNLSAFSLMIIILSVVFIYLVPGLSTMQYSPYEGTWQGIFWHKNHLGMFLALSNILFLCKFLEKKSSSFKEAAFWGASYLFSLFVLSKTEAVGAYLSAIFIHGVFVVAFVWMKIRSSLRSVHYLIFLLIILIASVLVFTNLDLIFGFFGRSTSLTGRIPLWKTLFTEYFLKHPLIGYGLNAFWYYPSHDTEVASLVGWSIPPIISDNGFFDIFLSIGLIGFISFFVFYIAVWLDALGVLKKAEACQDIFPITFMSFTFIANISFSLIYETEAYIMLIMMILMFSIGNKKLR